MRKLLPINNFAKAGLNTDLIPWDLPPGYFTFASNIRINSETITQSGGSEPLDAVPVDLNPGLLVYINPAVGSQWLLAGDKIYSYNASTFSDITPVAGLPPALNKDDWNGTVMSNIPILSNISEAPLYWPSPSGAVPMEVLPWDATESWADANQTCRVMRSHKQYLFALDLIDNGVNIPDGVRWSSPADIGGLPETWDPLDTTNFAGITTLGGDGGRIIDGLTLRDAFVVYRERGITVFDFVGGNFVWRVRNLDTTASLIAPNCVVEVKGFHYFIANGDVIRTDGNRLESLFHKRVQRQFSTELSAEYYRNSFVVKNLEFQEIWFCIPTKLAQYPDKAYVYNWRDDTISVRELPNLVSAAYGSLSAPRDTWDNYTQLWDENTAPWQSNTITPFDDTLLGLSEDTLFFSDFSSINNSEPFNSVFERVGLAIEGVNVTTTITRLYPHVTGTGSFVIELGSQDYPGAPVRWKAPVTFTPEQDRKVDIRTTGELHCMRFSGFSDSTVFAISGVDIEYVVDGER